MSTPRDNLLRLLHRQGYDAVPYEFALCPHLIEVYHEKEGSSLPYDAYFGMPWKRLPDLVPDQDDRTRFLRYHEGLGNDPAFEIDEWGVGHRATPTSMHMTKMLFPLEDAEDVQEILDYPLPSYSLKNNADLADRVKALHDRGIASVGNMQCTIWETSWYLRGMENLMMDMLTDEDMAAAILDRVAAMSTQRALLYANAGCDILFLGDDIGMQHSIMMSRELYTTWIQPRLKKLIAAVKAVRPDIIVFYHSCGFIEPLIDDLIDAGIDVLNPIQSECMDFAEIYAKYHDRLVFHGTIGTQTVMPFGTPEEVRAEVWKNLDIAKEGGLFVAPTHLLEPEVPWQNILAYVQACREYPLSRRG